MKRVITLAGVPPSAYWAATLAVSCLIFLAPTVYAIVLVVALPVKALTGGHVMGSRCCIVYTYTDANYLILCTYCSTSGDVMLWGRR